MPTYDGEQYNDDRIFILDYGLAEEGQNRVWCVVTRRNTPRFPPFRFDRFESENEAIDFIKKIEPATPVISLNGKSPNPELSYEEYLNWLARNQIPSSLEIHAANGGPLIKVAL